MNEQIQAINSLLALVRHAYKILPQDSHEQLAAFGIWLNDYKQGLDEKDLFTETVKESLGAKE